MAVDFRALDGDAVATDLPAGSTLKWDFGDDSPMAEGNQVSHTFTKSGTFVVALSLALANGLGTVGCSQAIIEVSNSVLQSGKLTVGPNTGLTGSGTLGGPFSPTNATYTLTNSSGATISWTAAKTASWLTLSKTGGLVEAGGTDSVSVSFGADAADLAAGTYSDTVTFSAGDAGIIGTRQVSLTVNPIAPTNHQPTAIADSYTVNEDATLSVAAPGVLANDVDLDNDPLTAVLVSNASHGTVSLNANGSFTYTPAANYNGSDSFAYGAYDGKSNSPAVLVSITVHAVNDPPSFAVPANQSAGVGSPIQVTMTSVSAGPADESSQTVTFTASSSNQAVVPNANLIFAGAQLTITATATGSATITVTAQDNGGTANGGTDTCVHTFGVTVFDGVPISGTLSLVDTVGARPKFGQHTLLLTGTGASAGQNFTVTTDVDGHYTQGVPTGWTGTITAQDPSRMVFLDPATKSGYDQNGNDVSVRTISTPVTAPGLSGEDILVWTAPIGIPGPDFGIRESHWMYKTGTYDYGNGPEAYHDAGNGPYTHYVDNSDPNATDTNNPYGTALKPRKTIPNPGDAGTLPAGSVIEIHGGPYTGTQRLQGQGTASEPVFYHGVGASMPMAGMFRLRGTYTVAEHLRFSSGAINRYTFTATADHVVLRDCEIAGTGQTTDNIGLLMGGYEGTDVSHALVINTLIHTLGWLDNPEDEDRHAINIVSGVHNTWVLDSHLWDTSGSGVQSCGEPGRDDDASSRIRRPPACAQYQTVRYLEQTIRRLCFCPERRP